MTFPEYLIEMVCRTPPVTQVVPRSTPVVSFGNALTAKVATLGINPSVREFLEDGSLLKGQQRRLATIDSLEAVDTQTLNRQQVESVLLDCWNYFSPDRNPYHTWFRPLDCLMRTAVGASYYDGTACHLDLVQWATTPVWGKIRSTAVKRALLEDTHPHLVKQLDNGNLRTVLLNGRAVVSQVQAEGLAKLRENAEMLYCGSVPCRLFVGNRGDIKFIGWSTNLQSSFGVSKLFCSQLAEWIASVG